jgi:hypothetical protein
MAFALDPDVETWTKDWKRLRHQKHRIRGGVEGAMLLDYLLYEGEHQSVQVQKAILTRAFRHERDKNKLRLVINLARRLCDRKIGRHWSIAHKYRATPNTNDALAFDLADVVGEQLIPAMDYKLSQDTLRWQILKWIVICGVCVEHVDWKDGITVDRLPKYDETGTEVMWKDNLTGAEIPESQVQMLTNSGKVPAERFAPAMEVQKAGDVGGDIYDPFRVFIDSAVPSVKALGPDQAIYLADIRTVGWIKETFGADIASKVKPSRDLSIIETQLLDRGIPVSGVNLKDLLPLSHGSQDKDDPDMCVVLTRYCPPSEEFPGGCRGFFIPDQIALDKGDLPYPEIPVVDYHWSTPGATFWTTGFIRDMQALSKFINKRFSQLGEAANAQIYEMLLLGGDLKAKDIPSDFPGVVEGGMSDEGMPLVQPVPRGNLPPFFPESIKLSMDTLDMLGGSDLLSQRNFPGQMRGSLTLPMIQEIIDSEDGPRFSHLAEQFSLEKQMRINRIHQFYPPIRTLNYTGEDMRHEVLELHTDELLRAGVSYTITVDPGTLVPEMSAMREARVRERIQWAPGLYTSPRTGTMDWSRVAEDLKYNDRQRESIATQSRKLARQFVRWARSGKLMLAQGPPNPQTGQPTMALVREQGQPFTVLPFWDHNSMMDEYESEMTKTEFLDSSPEYQRVMFTLHGQHRNILAQIDQARQNSVNDKMIQGAVAQATQQAAAKAASTATDMAIQQVMAQKDGLTGHSDVFGGMQQQVRALLGGTQAQGPTSMEQQGAQLAQKRQLRS